MIDKGLMDESEDGCIGWYVALHKEVDRSVDRVDGWDRVGRCKLVRKTRLKAVVIVVGKPSKIAELRKRGISKETVNKCKQHINREIDRCHLCPLSAANLHHSMVIKVVIAVVHRSVTDDNWPRFSFDKKAAEYVHCWLMFHHRNHKNPKQSCFFFVGFWFGKYWTFHELG